MLKYQSMNVATQFTFAGKTPLDYHLKPPYNCMNNVFKTAGSLIYICVC